MTWEERWHPLREEWVIVAAHRQNRPWSGEVLSGERKLISPYVDDCYLCPGNVRVSGAVNPAYQGVFVFDNDHPCVAVDAPANVASPPGIYQSRPAQGIARVVCYSPRHDLSLAQLEVDEIENLLATWQRQYTDLGRRAEIEHVLIFENKGEAVGVSNPHPHCQIYGTNFVFKTIANEAAASHRYLNDTGRPIFQDIIATEQREAVRIICENESAIAFLPYFARYAYEVFVAPKRAHPSIASLNDTEARDFAALLKEVVVRFDN